MGPAALPTAFTPADDVRASRRLATTALSMVSMSTLWTGGSKTTLMALGSNVVTSLPSDVERGIGHKSRLLPPQVRRQRFKLVPNEIIWLILFTLSCRGYSYNADCEALLVKHCWKSSAEKALLESKGWPRTDDDALLIHHCS